MFGKQWKNGLETPLERRWWQNRWCFLILFNGGGRYKLTAKVEAWTDDSYVGLFSNYQNTSFQHMIIYQYHSYEEVNDGHSWMLTTVNFSPFLHFSKPSGFFSGGRVMILKCNCTKLGSSNFRLDWFLKLIHTLDGQSGPWEKLQ